MSPLDQHKSRNGLNGAQVYHLLISEVAVFDNTTSFKFHAHAIPPKFPNWIDAEIDGGFGDFTVIFGEKL